MKNIPTFFCMPEYTFLVCVCLLSGIVSAQGGTFPRKWIAQTNRSLKNFHPGVSYSMDSNSQQPHPARKGEGNIKKSTWQTGSPASSPLDPKSWFIAGKVSKQKHLQLNRGRPEQRKICFSFNIAGEICGYGLQWGGGKMGCGLSRWLNCRDKWEKLDVRRLSVQGM